MQLKLTLRGVSKPPVWRRLLVQRRHVTWESLKWSLGPGALFGVNIAFFFSAVTHTHVANVEFTGSLNQ